MRQAMIKYKEKDAGILQQHDDGSFTFRYLDSWFADQGNPPISLTLPLSQKEFHSEYLFPFFFHLLPEGANKEVVCHAEQLDADDYFRSG